MTSLKPNERKFWSSFLKAEGLLDQASSLRVYAGYPGNAGIADTLILLYRAGKKTAASGIVQDYETAGDPLPKAGDFWILLNGQGEPACIVRTIRTEIHPWNEVTEEIAIAEAEGDLSIEAWRDIHLAFYRPFFEKWGIRRIEDAMVITEFFHVYRFGQ